MEMAWQIRRKEGLCNQWCLDISFPKRGKFSYLLIYLFVYFFVYVFMISTANMELKLIPPDQELLILPTKPARLLQEGN